MLDDVERAHADLSMEELLGFVSSLTENSKGLTENTKTKVLLIYNEDDKREALSIYREKVIGVEMEFRPNEREQINEFLDDARNRKEVVEVLTKHFEENGGANIRLIFKVNEVISAFQKLFVNKIKENPQLLFDSENIDAFYKECSSNTTLAKIARCVLLYHRSPSPTTEGRAQTSTENDWLNELIKMYLHKGCFPIEKLKKNISFLRAEILWILEGNQNGSSS